MREQVGGIGEKALLVAYTLTTAGMVGEHIVDYQKVFFDATPFKQQIGANISSDQTSIFRGFGSIKLPPISTLPEVIRACIMTSPSTFPAFGDQCTTHPPGGVNGCELHP